MSSFKFIVGAFGLQSVKTIRYDEKGTALDTKSSLEGLPAKSGIKIPAEAYSYLGTPVFSRLTLVNPENRTVKIDLDEVLIEISQSVNVVTTAINGRDGTIKEYISASDWNVSIRGVLVNPQDGYNPPIQQFQTLLQLCSLPVALECESKYLQLFDIFNLVITEKSFPQSKGFQNVQPFELSCISDKPIELLIDVPSN